MDAVAGQKGEMVDAIAREFVEFLKAHGHLHRVRDIIRAIDQVWQEHFGAATISVASAAPLSDRARQALEKAAKGAAVTETVDPTLLGGARIRIDDRLLDGSVAAQLDRLRRSLES